MLASHRSHLGIDPSRRTSPAPFFTPWVLLVACSASSADIPDPSEGGSSGEPMATAGTEGMSGAPNGGGAGGDPSAAGAAGAGGTLAQAGAPGGGMPGFGGAAGTPGAGGAGGAPITPSAACMARSVVGTGTAGTMDNLERMPAALQMPANAATSDGRDGAWSWYPMTAMATIAMEAGNSYLSFSGTGLALHAGASLAFLGANGGNACYDGSAYQGISFRIRGSVTPSNIVTVSLITAETQTTALGGDLATMGGHFHRQVAVSPDWQPVQIPWAMFARPTWGDTTMLPAPAVTKLQAIDFGVANTDSAFAVAIDDVALY